MKIVRKKLGIILGLSLFLLFSSAAAWAVDNSQQFNFTIQAGDSTSTSVSVQQGEVITVNAFLELKDSSNDYALYSMQDEIAYETEYFELVSGTMQADSSYSFCEPFVRNWPDQGLQKVVFSFITDNLSGTQFAPKAKLGSFQLKVLQTGTATISNTEYEVGTYDGMDKYAAEGNQIQVTIKTSGGGSDSGSSSSGLEKYTNMIAPCTGCSMKFSPASAAEGDRVTINLTLEEGYLLDSLTAVDGNGQAVSLTDNGDGSYSFIQPNSMVTVTPVLKAKSSDESDQTDTSATPPGTPTPDNPTEDTVSPDKFTDIQEHWAKDFIYYAVEHNLFKGVSDTAFEPETPTTRAMLVTTLYNLAGQPNGYQTAGFSDVAAGSWYEAAVNWGYANVVIKGYGDGTFAPLKLVTREEMVTILHNYYHFVNPNLTEAEEVQGDLNQFADLSSLSSYARQSMAWAVGSNLIHGRSNNLLCPQADSTRAEAATVLSLFLQKILLVK